MAPPIQRTPFIAERFSAVDEEGNRHAICYWMWRHVVTYNSGETDVTTSGWKYETEDGQHINQTDDGHFAVARTGTRLTRE